MSLVYKLQQPGGSYLEITDRCRLYQFDMEEKAEEGAVAVNQLIIDDPLGDLEVHGHKLLIVYETEAVDPDDAFVFVGFIGDAKIIRGPGDRTGAARQWVCEVSDPNTILSRRVMRGDDNDRPDETDNARIGWVLTTHETNQIDDTRYVTSSDPWNMDEADYVLQEALAVYADCSRQSGKNYFATYFGDVGTAPYGAFSLWYEHAEADVYSSTAFLTNVLADVDVENGQFYIGLSEETSFSRKFMRVYSHPIVPYKDSYVTASNPTTVTEYARRDVVMPAPNVKKKSTAQARAARYARDLASPDDRATVKTTVPRQLVNLIRPGMQVPVRVSHWPEEYRTDYVWMRVLGRRVKEISEVDPLAAFELTLEVSRGVPGPAPGPVYGILRRSQINGTQTLVYWDFPGDTPAAGYPTQPTTGMLTVLTDGSPPMADYPHPGFEVTGTGTIDVTFFATVAGVGGPITCTFAITKNGATVASSVATHPGGFVGMDGEVSVSALAVAPGDVIAATIVPSYFPYFWVSPRGTGQAQERLEITGGSLS